MARRMMPEPGFLIRHPDGREYGLRDSALFAEHYEPAGFAIVDPAPPGYIVPERPKPKPKASAPPAKASDKPDKPSGDAPPPSV